MTIEENEESGGLAVQESKPKAFEPLRYAVVLYNDHYTTMDFVVDVLSRFFHKNPEEAARIMLLIHERGKGKAGEYNMQIAETKVAQVHEYARSNGFPLKCTVELAGT